MFLVDDLLLLPVDAFKFILKQVQDLTPHQIEDLGLALMKLEVRMKELKCEFGLSDEDLNLDLGPLGRLM